MHGGNVEGEGFGSFGSNFVSAPWPASYELLVAGDVADGFEFLEVNAQGTIGSGESFLQGSEIEFAIFLQRAKNAEPERAVNGGVDPIEIDRWFSGNDYS